MGRWPVEDENPVDFCRHMIEDAEMYIGIFNGPGTKNIVKLEYGLRVVWISAG
ncbi:MAG TPA: hypothetical protein VHP83_25145 [Aggregatilineaceae bacterium]|nr:hypothetical protein [Aggregatilineaceae bacterium]